MTPRAPSTELFASLALVAACGGGPDLSTVVTVRVLDRIGDPVAGVEVYGHEPDGVLGDQAVTDGDGIAYLSIAAGGSATIHHVDPSVPAEFARPDWTTVLAVAPGDELPIRVARGPERTRPVPVTVPALPAGAVGFTASAPCAEGGSGSATTPATLWVDRRCPAHGPLLLTALGPGPWPAPVVAYLTVADVDLTAASIAATGVWAAPVDDYTVELSGVPAGGSAQIARGTLAGGYPIQWHDHSVTAPTASYTAPRPSIGDGVVYRVRTGDGDFCASHGREYVRSRAADVDRFTLDLAELLPTIDDVHFGDRRIDWTGGGGAASSGVGVLFEAALGNGDVVGATRTWYVVAPPGTTSIEYPADVGFTWPAGQHAGDRVTAIYLGDVASTRWGSYAEVRAHWSDDPPRIDGDFVTRTTSLQQQYAYLGCPFGP